MNNFIFSGHSSFEQNSFLNNNNNQITFSNPQASNLVYCGFEGTPQRRSKEAKQNITPILHNGANVYQVKFKKGVRYYLRKPDVPFEYRIDDIVVVESDRGEDIGVVSGIFTAAMYCEARRQNSIRCGTSGVKEEEGSWDLRYISRYATAHDMQLVTIKNAEEAAVTQRARELAYRHYRLPINIVDAEFQFDRNKLTIIYETNSRVDFRDFVRELFSIYKVRIWMQQIEVIESDSNDYSSVQLQKTESVRPYAFNHTNSGENISPSNGIPSISLVPSNYTSSLNQVSGSSPISLSSFSNYGENTSRTSPISMESAIYGNGPSSFTMPPSYYNFQL